MMTWNRKLALGTVTPFSLPAIAMAVIVSITMLPGHLSHASAMDDDGGKDGDEALFHELRERYLELDQYSDRMTRTTIVEYDGRDAQETTTHEMTLRWETPNRFAVESWWEGHLLTALYCDGEALFATNVAMEQFAMWDAAESIGATLTQIEEPPRPVRDALQHPVLSILWPDEHDSVPVELVIHRDVTLEDGRRRIVGELQIDSDGFEARQAEAGDDTLYPYKIMLDAKHGLISRFELDMTLSYNNALAAFPGNHGANASRYRIVTRIDVQEVNQKVHGHLFEYEPPEHYKKLPDE